MDKINRICNAIHREMGIEKQELLQSGRNTQRHTLARQILCHLYISQGGTKMGLAQSSLVSITSWSHNYAKMQHILKTSADVKELYNKIKTRAFPERKKKKQESQQVQPPKIPVLAIKWTILDEIHIENAIQDSVAFMRNYGKAQ